MGDHTNISVPKDLATEIDNLLDSGYMGFRNRSEFTRDAIRRRLDHARQNGNGLAEA